jgi:hypothetical protein
MRNRRQDCTTFKSFIIGHVRNSMLKHASTILSVTPASVSMRCRPSWRWYEKVRDASTLLIIAMHSLNKLSPTIAFSNTTENVASLARWPLTSGSLLCKLDFDAEDI